MTTRAGTGVVVVCEKCGGKAQVVCNASTYTLQVFCYDCQKYRPATESVIKVWAEQMSVNSGIPADVIIQRRNDYLEARKERLEGVK